jgi:molecular chaperone GrpE
MSTHDEDQHNKKPSKADEMNSGVQGGKQWPTPDKVTDEEEDIAGIGQESVEQLEQELNESEQKLQDYYNEMMRSKAEIENVRRRAERDVVNARKFALEKFLGDLLPVIDSLGHALMCEFGDNAFAKSIHEGVEMTANMLNQTMERYGVKAIDPLGQPFDPNQHQAIGMEPAGDQAPNIVIRVMQKGFVLNERVIRPAMVVVSK